MTSLLTPARLTLRQCALIALNHDENNWHAHQQRLPQVDNSLRLKTSQRMMKWFLHSQRKSYGPQTCCTSYTESWYRSSLLRAQSTNSNSRCLHKHSWRKIKSSVCCCLSRYISGVRVCLCVGVCACVYRDHTRGPLLTPRPPHRPLNRYRVDEEGAIMASEGERPKMLRLSRPGGMGTQTARVIKNESRYNYYAMLYKPHISLSAELLTSIFMLPRRRS